MKVQVKNSQRQSTKKILTFARLQGSFILCFLTYLYFINYFVVKRIRFKPNVYIADELFCANGQFLVGDANGDG